MSKSNIYEPVYIQFSSLLNQGVHNACMHSIVGYHNKKNYESFHLKKLKVE